MRNQAETQKNWSKGTSIRQHSMLCLTRGGSENNRFQSNLSPNLILSRSIGPLGCAIKQKHKRNRPKGLQFSKILCIICLEGRGEGVTEDNRFQKINCSKSNSITFYRFLGMRNQADTQKKRSQGTSTWQNSIHYYPRTWSQNNRFQNNLLQIRFYNVLQFSKNSMHYLPREEGGGV